MDRESPNVDIGMDWKLTEAKNRLSEVVSRALTDGPQRITRRDEAVVVVSEQAFGWLTGSAGGGFVAYLMNGPTFEGVEVERDRAPMRDVAL